MALLGWTGCGRLVDPPRTPDSRQPSDAELYDGAIGTPSIDLTGWATAVESAGAVRGVPKRIRRTADGAEMALIPSGRFLMGNPHGEFPWSHNEREQHEVTLTRWYYMDVNEVTVGQFRSFVDATEYRTDAESGRYSVSVGHGPDGGRIADRDDWRATLQGGVPSRVQRP